MKNLYCTKKNSLNCGRIWKGERKGKAWGCCPSCYYVFIECPQASLLVQKCFDLAWKEILNTLLIWSQPQMCILIDPKPEESYNVKGSKYIKWSFDIEGQNRVQKNHFEKSLNILCNIHSQTYDWYFMIEKMQTSQDPQTSCFSSHVLCKQTGNVLELKDLASKLLFITMPLTFCSGNFWLKGQLSVKFSVDAC